MLRLSLFAGLAGLHLAVLQFCYFFLLLINVTSTYITYITIVVAWMVGTMIGLGWRRITPLPSLVAGVAAYYLTCVLVLGAPLATQLLPIAAVGVAVTGLWAGHLFVSLLPQFERADQLFLHENNGFLLGIVAVFIGFTLGGQAFLLGAPAVSLAVQIAFLYWLRLRPPAPVQTDVPPIAPGPPAVRLSDTAWHGLKRFAVLAVALNVLIPGGMLVNSALTGEPYWRAFHGEDNALTWFSSLQLLLVGLTAYVIFQTSGLLSQLAGRACNSRRWIWLVFTLGFIFLSVDEHFELHEMLRDEGARSMGLFTDIDWIRPGDVGLYIYLLVGAAFGLVLLKELRRHGPAQWLFVAAVATSAVIVVVDALPTEIIATWPVAQFWNSVFEEVGETCGGLLFLLSFIVFLRGEIKEYGRHADGTARV